MSEPSESQNTNNQDDLDDDLRDLLGSVDSDDIGKEINKLIIQKKFMEKDGKQ